jgi:hypothetical protein
MPVRARSGRRACPTANCPAGTNESARGQYERESITHIGARIGEARHSAERIFQAGTAVHITKDLVEPLLWEEESATLDFKAAQYPFAGATERERSELLKDILAFANAHRREDAFILLGVREVKGGRSEVVGIDHQLEDAHLQQFIKGRVQRPIIFSYTAMEYDGLPIAILRITKQKRPFYAVTDFGMVRKEAVYVRRGSSTDIASPDEIAAMGADQIASHALEPVLAFSACDRATGQILGTTLELKCVALDLPDAETIPDYSEGSGELLQLSPWHVNKDYFRELAKFISLRNLLRRVSFSVNNAGEVTAHDVRVVFDVPDASNVFCFMEHSEVPDPPTIRSEFIATRIHNFVRPNVKSRVEVQRMGDVWHIECFFGKVQPKGTARLAEDLYIGSFETMQLSVETKIFADNLSRPLNGPLEFRFEVENREATMEDVKRLEFERYSQTPEGREELEGIQTEAEEE